VYFYHHRVVVWCTHTPVPTHIYVQTVGQFSIGFWIIAENKL